MCIGLWRLLAGSIISILSVKAPPAGPEQPRELRGIVASSDLAVLPAVPLAEELGPELVDLLLAMTADERRDLTGQLRWSAQIRQA